jgi:hypothetical protein
MCKPQQMIEGKCIFNSMYFNWKTAQATAAHAKGDTSAKRKYSSLKSGSEEVGGGE